MDETAGAEDGYGDDDEVVDVQNISFLSPNGSTEKNDDFCELV